MSKQTLASDKRSYSNGSLLLGIWVHISPRHRLQLGLLFVVMLASGAAELLSLGAVLPFLAVLSNPNNLWQQPLVQNVSRQVGIKHVEQLLPYVTIVFVLALLLSALIRSISLFLSGRLAAAVGSYISCEAYRRTLYQPYAVHVQRNSSAVISGTTSQVGATIAALNSFLQMLSSTVITAALLGGALWFDWRVALVTIALFSISYSIIVTKSRKVLRVNGVKIAHYYKNQLKALQEGLGAIRDVLLDGLQPTYLEIYRQSDFPLRRLEAKNNFVAGFPRYILESLGMVCIAILGYVLASNARSETLVISLLGTFALAAQRLLPNLQQIFVGWAQIKSYSASIEDVLGMLNQAIPDEVLSTSTLKLESSIRLESVSFRYSSDQANVINDIDLEIFRGEHIGFIGRTGSGKSTMVDLLMGLLQPTWGKLLIDGKDLHDPTNSELLASWRSSIAHVPQSIFLVDSSIAENIALGIPADLIDFQRLKYAAHLAQISDLIEAMPDQYNSYVGERGVKLSGGQRQRIGIARALYRQSSILVFDEATSALDVETEKAVIESINELNDDLTILMVAHRLSTVRNCDRVIRFAQGSIVADGHPDLVLTEKNN